MSARGDVMPLEPGQAVRLMPWAVPRLDTSRLIAANHDVAAPGIPEYSRAAAWRPADAHPIPADLPASAFACRTRNPTGLVPGGFPRIRGVTARTARPRYRLGGAE